MNKNPTDIVRYILFKCAFFGDVITNLKMQKVLYYVYVWAYIEFKEVLFTEKFEAWPNGPVLPSVYGKLKQFGSSPIDLSFADLESQEDLNSLVTSLGNELTELIDDTFEKYGSKSAFELVNLTHNELPWKNARKGLDTLDPSKNTISLEDIRMQYGKA